MIAKTIFALDTMNLPDSDDLSEFYQLNRRICVPAMKHADYGVVAKFVYDSNMSGYAALEITDTGIYRIKKEILHTYSDHSLLTYETALAEAFTLKSCDDDEYIHDVIISLEQDIANPEDAIDSITHSKNVLYHFSALESLSGPEFPHACIDEQLNPYVMAVCEIMRAGELDGTEPVSDAVRELVKAAISWRSGNIQATCDDFSNRGLFLHYNLAEEILSQA